MTYQETTAAIAATIAAACVAGGVATSDPVAILSGIGFASSVPSLLNPPPDNES